MYPTVTSVLTFIAGACLASATGLTKPVKNVVVFGDSFSDTGIWGSLIWPDYLGNYLNIPVSVFAKAGATCSNKLTPRIWPDVIHNETSLYTTKRNNGTLGRLDPSTTVYTLWIGTNDVGSGCLLTGDQAPGVTLFDTVKCAVNWVKTMYDGGARNFLFQNMVPLHRSPMYKRDAYLTRYWTIPNNQTEMSLFMESEVTSGNALSGLLLRDLAPTLHGAHIGVFDSYGLFNDIIDHPSRYLNGTAPLNTTSCVNACPYAPYGTEPQYCTVANGTDADSYVWWDELHPSDQTHRIVAREIASVLKGKATKWVQWL